MGFFQAARLLGLATPDAVKVRFEATARLSFQPSDFSSAEEEGTTLVLRLNGFGLTGPSGALPLVYSDLVHQRRRLSDLAPGDFLNLFSHRAAMLLFRAWRKHQGVIAFEAAGGTGQDSMTGMLMGLSGLTVESAAMSGLAAPTLAGFAGLLSTHRRSAAALGEAISAFAGFRVTLHMLQPRWLEIDRSEQSRLGSVGGQYHQLGTSAVAGARALDVQSSIMLVSEPLGACQFQRCIGDDGYRRKLQHFVRTLVAPHVSVIFNPVLRACDVTAAVLSGTTALGLGGWLFHAHRKDDGRECHLSF